MMKRPQPKKEMTACLRPTRSRDLRRPAATLVLALFVSVVGPGRGPASASPYATDRLTIIAHFVTDPTIPTIPADTSYCSRAPFVANGSFEGSLLTFQTAGDGRVVAVGEEIGYARACILAVDLTFTPFLVRVPIYYEVEIYDLGDFVAHGECTATNNDVPARPVVLGGCALRLDELPTQFIGGSLTESGDVFNPYESPLVPAPGTSFHTYQLFYPPEEPVEEPLLGPEELLLGTIEDRL